MSADHRLQRPMAGILFIMLGMLAISLNDVLIKFMSNGYPLHQMVFTRSAIGIVFSLTIVQFEGGWSILRPAHPLLQLIRGLLVVIANLTFFSALAVLPLAEATAIFFVAPLFITLLGMLFLGEKVGPMRLAAVVIGFIGVLVMTRPWESAETRAVSLVIYFLPVLGALTYAANQVLTRYLGVSAPASAMAVYVQGMFVIVSLGFGLIAGDGRYATGLENESLIFLLRAWHWPQGVDIWLFALLGLNSAVVGYSLAQAYRLANAATVAPFEYIGLPMAVFWGWLIWDELPAPIVWLGIVLVMGSGLFVFFRERLKERRLLTQKRVHRRY